MARVNKTVKLEELPGLLPSDGLIALGGGWFSNHPMAAVRELLRADQRGLNLLSLLGTIDVDLLVGAGLVDRLTFSMVTLEAFGLAQQFRRAVQSGKLAITEIPALSLQVALEAGAMSVPFLPLRGPIGSDLVTANPEVFGSASTSFGHENVMVVKAIRPAVSIVHALRCDRLGNAQFEGTFGQDPEMAAASERVIVTCEEIVDSSEIARRPDTTKIPGYLVDAVIEAPFGAHPCSHVPRYAQDAWEILAYQRASLSGDEEYGAYVDQLKRESEAEYRTRTLGANRGSVLEVLASSGRALEASA